MAVPIAILFSLSMPSAAQAANRYWVGGSDGANTNDTANWASADPASCTGGGASVPGSSDVAIFDADCDNGATINATFTPGGMQLRTGYSGTVTQATGITVIVTGNYTQSGGTLTGGDSAITVNDGNFTLFNGTFTNTSGGLNVERNFTISGGTFTNTSNTVTFVDSNSTDDTVVACSGTLGGMFVVTKDAGSDFKNSTGCGIGLAASPTTAIGNNTTGVFTNSGTMCKWGRSF